MAVHIRQSERGTIRRREWRYPVPAWPDPRSVANAPGRPVRPRPVPYTNRSIQVFSHCARHACTWPNDQLRGVVGDRLDQTQTLSVWVSAISQIHCAPSTCRPISACRPSAGTCHRVGQVGLGAGPCPDSDLRGHPQVRAPLRRAPQPDPAGRLAAQGPPEAGGGIGAD